MIIAVNTRHLADHIFDCFSILAEKYPQHQFIYIFDAAYAEQLITSNNIIPVVIGPEARSVLRRQYWYRYKVPVVLRKYKADVFINMDGSYLLRTKVPQPKDLSGLSKFASPVFQPIDEQEREGIKEKYTEGNEYFLYPGPIGPGSNLLNLLKAFSFFKKRQKSSMQLVIAGSTVPGYKQFAKELQTFKYRNEVKLLPGLSKNEQAKLTAGAYAMVYPVLGEDLSTHTLEAMQCGVPVVVGNGQLAIGNEQLAIAMLCADPGDFMDIADKMMTLFKDERRRNELIMAGKAAAAAFSPARTADMLWDCINFAAAHV